MVQPTTSANIPGALLLDTNILLALALPNHHNTTIARPAVANLKTMGTQLCIAPQTLYEFYAVVTRPRDAVPSGPNWKPKGSLAALENFTQQFRLLPDAPDVFFQWRQLIEKHDIISKPSHDARLAAHCLVYNVGILTANTGDFQRFTPSGLVVIDPAMFATLSNEPMP